MRMQASCILACTDREALNSPPVFTDAHASSATHHRRIFAFHGGLNLRGTSQWPHLRSVWRLPDCLAGFVRECLSTSSRVDDRLTSRRPSYRFQRSISEMVAIPVMASAIAMAF